MGTGKRDNSQSDERVKVTTRWCYVSEVTPAFKRLMDIVLKPRPDPHTREAKEVKRGSDMKGLPDTVKQK